MIELVIAALIQLGSLTTDASATPSAFGETPQQTTTTTTTTTTTDSNPGGTGSWDDNG